MDHRITNINSQYLILIKKVKKRLDNREKILDVLDEIELFWMKQKPFICEYLKYQKCSYIGGAMYIYFDEYEHKLPMCYNNILIMDEPICKMINMFRLSDLIDENRMKEILLHIVDNVMENKKIIKKKNILIVPIRSYYSDISNDIGKISNSFTYQSLTEFSNCKIQNKEDLIEFSKTIKNVDELDNAIKPDYVFTYPEDIDKSITEKMISYCKSSGRIINSSNPSDIIEVLYEFLYGKFCQAIDLINITDILNVDLFVFREDVVYYLNLIKNNFDKQKEKIHNIIEQTIITMFLHKELLKNDYKINDKIISDKKLRSILNKLIHQKDKYMHDGEFELKQLRDIIVKEIK